jgi:hypothetical protein
MGKSPSENPNHDYFSFYYSSMTEIIKPGKQKKNRNPLWISVKYFHGNLMKIKDSALLQHNSPIIYF